jgi:NADH dehydrogenase FAD-containing subunit
VYDALVYAPGSAADPEVVPGGREHGFTLADAASSRALHARLRAARPGDRVVVVGGGLTAIEAAAEIAEAFPALRVALAARGGVGEGLSERGRGYLGRALGELGVAVRTGVRAVRVDAGGLLVVPGEREDVAAGRERDHVAAGRERDDVAAGAAERIAADIVVLAAGFRPAALAASSGLATVAGGRLSVDRWLRAPAHPEIWGVGDAAAVLDGEGAPLRMGCATAMPQAAYAADGIVAALAGDPQPPPFRFAFLIQCISLGRRRGLIQRVDPRDRPLERVLTGRLGALAKELVCRFTVASLHVERLSSGSYSWPGKEPRRPGAIGAADDGRLPSGAAT